MADEDVEKMAIEAMENMQWSKAARYLSLLLNNPKKKKNAAYNLIVCYIKLENPIQSQATLNKFQNLLTHKEIEELQREIYKIPTKVGENGLKGLSWYKSNITLNDVIGLKKVKESIREKIILPMQNQNIYKEYGVKGGGGFIMFGPPGTGKTLLAKAIAGETGIRMLIANIKELVSKYQGESAKNIGTIFKQAREGGPAIIFFDEIDSLAQSRSNSSISSTGGEDRRIANALLTELDGAQADNSNVYVIGATNMPWELDDAITRSGRFNSFIYISPPNTLERIELFKYYTSKLKVGKLDYLKLSLMTFGFSPADIEAICKSSAEHALAKIMLKNEQHRNLTTEDFIWGIKQFSQAPLLKSYASALESLKGQSQEKLQQFKDMKKDIEFFYRSGEQRHKLYNVISQIV